MSQNANVYDKQVAWKLDSQFKLAMKSQELRAQDEHDWTFSPKTTERMPINLTTNKEVVRDSDVETTLLHPTESQETSIQLHLARYGQAREQALEAQHKLHGTTQQTKDYSKVTSFEPFALSRTNWKPRQSTIDTAVKIDQVKPNAKTGGTKGRSKSSKSLQGLDSSVKDEKAWERERATLVAIIDAQRQELAQREQAQQEAVRVAEQFAAATQAFEERLLAVELSAAKEREEVKRLLASQAASTDLILTSLGIKRSSTSSSNSR